MLVDLYAGLLVAVKAANDLVNYDLGSGIAYGTADGYGKCYGPVYLEEFTCYGTKEADKRSSYQESSYQGNYHVEQILKAEGSKASGNYGEHCDHQKSVHVRLDMCICRKEAKYAEDDTHDQIHDVCICQVGYDGYA